MLGYSPAFKHWSNVSFNPKPRLVYSSNPMVYEMAVGNVGNADNLGIV